MGNLKVLKECSNFNVYETDNWKFENANRLVLSINEKIVECSLFEHFNEGGNKVKLDIEVSSTSGCPIKCKYCASSIVDKVKYLTSEEIFSEVKTCLEHFKVIEKDYPEFNVSFSGIGEPCLISENILKAAKMIVKTYPSVRFNIASLCLKPEMLDIINNSNLPFRSFWITYVHHDPKKCSEVIPTAKEFNYNFKKCIKYAKRFNLCKLKLNYVVIKDFNDSTKDIDKLLEIISELRNKLTIRITRINPTVSSERYSLSTVKPNKLREISAYLTKKGWKNYIYMTEFNDNLNCGQLIYNYDS